MVEQNICNVNIFAYMCWHEGQSTGMDFLYHTFVPVCTLKDRNGEAPIGLFVQNFKINVV